MSEHGSHRGTRGREAALVVAGLVVGGLALLGAQDLLRGRARASDAPGAAPEIVVTTPDSTADSTANAPAAGGDDDASSAGATYDSPAPAAAAVIVNGVALDESTLRRFERRYGMGVRPGDYWYDRATGAWGMRAGPTRGIIAAGLALGGPLRADASGGGSGSLTGVFVNGRELHPLDVVALARIVRQPIVPGRYWVDANGIGGQEGGPAYFDLAALAQQAGGAGGGQHRCLYCDVGTVGGDGSFTYYIGHDASATVEH